MFYSVNMTKQEAIQLLGEGNAAEMARCLQISRAYVSQWPDELTPKLRDWVVGAAYRLGKLPAEKDAPEAA